MASLGNIRENPHVGILMIDFSQDRIGLHVDNFAFRSNYLEFKHSSKFNVQSSR